MRSTQYQKPKFMKVELRNDNNVASNTDQCMAKTAQGTKTYYYDTPGDGWVQINIGHEDCSGNINKMNFIYLDNPNYNGELSDLEKNNMIIIAQKAVDGDKQAFNNSALFPEQPGTDWS